ncbi:unnamed protein product [Pneumocystis jirovecii]|uniref:Anaphase-promoting complex subunit 4 WD40 domain-containing protein n=1 Tax=Pneumocystis jirovecii TaxID=42068 RepID=L0PCV5_PNEJI|nr:unnamed protein product [Pneumocystis jirovecii]
MGRRSKNIKVVHKNHQCEKDSEIISSDLRSNINEKDEEEKILEAKVFGDINPFNDELKNALTETYDFHDSICLNSEAVDFSLLQDHELFYVDTSVDQKKCDYSLSKSFALNVVDKGFAWEDSDDERLVISLTSMGRLRKLRRSETDDTINGKEYCMRLREQFERVNPVPDWAVSKFLNDQDLKQDEDSNYGISEDSGFVDDVSIFDKSLKSLLMSSEGYVRKTTSSTLPPTTINIKRLRDANFCSPSESAILSLSFHSFYPLLLSGGYDRILRIFHIDGDVNPLVSSLYLRSSSIETAVFHPNDNKIMVGGRRKYFYIWDLESGDIRKVSRTYGHDDTFVTMEKFSLSPCGRFIGIIGNKGWFNVLSSRTGQWITGFKIEGDISSISWFKSGKEICIANRNGEIWEWDIMSQKVLSRWNDNNNVCTTKISLGGFDDRWFAVGSNTGVVNVYDRRDLFGESSKPYLYKTLDHLTTSINTLEFSPDGQILAMASREKSDFLRLIHFPTGSAYRNWPTASTPLGRISAVKFSPPGSEITIGNETGKIGLWRFAYYYS